MESDIIPIDGSYRFVINKIENEWIFGAYMCGGCGNKIPLGLKVENIEKMLEDKKVKKGQSFNMIVSENREKVDFIEVLHGKQVLFYEEGYEK